MSVIHTTLAASDAAEPGAMRTLADQDACNDFLNRLQRAKRQLRHPMAETVRLQVFDSLGAQLK